MYKEKKILAIIPARGGSKRLPRKNILKLNGKPLIEWTIDAGLNSKYIDDLVVSTDDKEIADVSKKAGALVPFLRPDYLSNDEAKSIDVIIHAILYLKEELKKNYDYVVLLQATSPLRDNVDVDNAIKYFFEKKADAVISVCEMEHSPLWSNVLPKDNSMINFLDEKILNKRSQDLETFYRINGAMYICSCSRFINEKRLFLKDNIFAYVMNKEKSIDIDDEFDFKFAEFILRKRLGL